MYSHKHFCVLNNPNPKIRSAAAGDMWVILQQNYDVLSWVLGDFMDFKPSIVQLHLMITVRQVSVTSLM